jgi:hypothetical protein
MYVLGVDLPLVEILLAVTIIGIIILLEITVMLVLISFHMRNSRKLEDKIGMLTNKLMQIEGKELQELKEIEHIAERKKRR